MRTTIVYEDEELLVACKPAGFPTQSAGVGKPDVVSELKNYLKNAYLGVVHRLDQPVEGLLVFGKNREITAALTRQLEDGRLKKRYYAVLDGEPVPAEGELTDHLYKTKENLAKIAEEDRVAETGAKKARLKYVVRDSVSGNDLAEAISLAEISIMTGRFHQIRAQMAHAGYPLLGDLKYGTEHSLSLSGRMQVKQVALCAYALQFYHPTQKEVMRFQIEPQAEIFRLFPKVSEG